MNDRFRNLDFDVPKLPNRKPRKPEPKEPEAMTFGGMTIAAMRAAAWNNVVTQQFITGESWKKI